MQIKDEILPLLKKGKNLLAFSYGSDSSALFHLLTQNNIHFDLIMVNYKTRKNSDLEESKAKELALKFNKKIFLKNAPFFEKNFEKNARDFRYEFFNQICLENAYNNLILAHQLNDVFEWFLMQLSRGAGLNEILGMQEFEKRKNFNIIRPLLFTSKDEILTFLKQNRIFYFLDESNENEKYFRNYIRKNFSNAFVSQFSNGLQRSFSYLNKDKNKIFNSKIQEFKGILACKKDETLIAKALKIQGLTPSAKQRQEMLKTSCVLSGKFCISYDEDKAFIFKFEKCKMPKEFKEKCRIAKIQKFLRPYLFQNSIQIQDFLNFRSQI